MRSFLCAVAALFLAAAASSAQVIVGGTGGVTTVLRDGHASNAGTLFGEIDYDAQYNDQLTGEIVQFTGIAADGGGPQVGLGYRQYMRVGRANSNARYAHIGIGVAGFGLGNDTPMIDELSIFIGPELLVRLPLGTMNSWVTGFVGFYPSASGQSDTNILRSGVSLSVN